MALAPYFSRVSDAVTSVAGLTADELRALLGGTIVHVDLAPTTAEPVWADGVALLGNLLGRLYPALAVTGPSAAVIGFEQAVQASNPGIELVSPDGAIVPVRFGDHAGSAGVLSVGASAWQVTVDEPGKPSDELPPQPLATLAAACLAAAEVFRQVFAGVLGDAARRAPQPGLLDLISADPARPAPPVGVEGVDLGLLHLAGAGAVGQACVLALAVSGASGTLRVVDPELLTMTNLQRYVLSTLPDVGVTKTELVARALGPVGWAVEQVPTPWGVDERSGPRQLTVLVALDSARDRLGVAAGVHDRVFNAFTQPADIGWSRHERFGIDPCLACLYYPDRPRPSEDELIATALHQPRLRVLSYLVANVPVGQPLPLVVQVADLPAPPDAQRWTQEPLLADLAAAGLLPAGQLAAWAGRTVGELYVEGVCGGGFVYPEREDLPAEVLVPLAHQSALAGVLLALQPLVAAVPDLAAARPPAVEGRLDLLRGLPQVVSRPRQRTPGCLCADPAFLAGAGAR